MLNGKRRPPQILRVSSDRAGMLEGGSDRAGMLEGGSDRAGMLEGGSDRAGMLEGGSQPPDAADLVEMGHCYVTEGGDVQYRWVVHRQICHLL